MGQPAESASKPARACTRECGRPAAPGRRECDGCRGKRRRRDPAQGTKQKRYVQESQRRGKAPKVWSNVGSLLTPTEWERLYLEQGGACAVCGHALRNRYAPTHRPDERIASVDHDHVVEHALRKEGVERDEAVRRSVRGLLCGFPCNRLLVRHWTRERLTNAARYLDHWPAADVLGNIIPARRQ